MTIDFDGLWALAGQQFALGADSIHGPSHWRRVEANGLWLAESSGADVLLVRLFAVLHDSRRLNESYDPQHGERAAIWATELRATWFPHVADAPFELLQAALIAHDRGEVSTDATIGTCWDADRLDLPRVGMTPHPKFMSTTAGKRRAGGVGYR